MVVIYLFRFGFFYKAPAISIHIMRFSIRLNLGRVTTNLRKQLNLKINKNLNNLKEQHDDDLKVKIGLEIHARILSKTKIFSDSNCFDAVNNSSAVNSNVSFFDAAFPGTMPTLNKRCVEASLITALVLKCNLNAVSQFERKHYFYADLPAGYQITQQRKPIAINGSFKYPILNPKTHKLSFKNCTIRRIQLEHDSAKSLKIENLEFKLNENEKLPENSVLIDLNRAGMGLMEIVTEPEFESAFDSYSFVRELALVLKSIGTCDAQMGEGGFRVDVNVSVHKLDRSTDPPQVLPGTRVELKNLSSFNAVLKATEHEIKRQKDLVKNNKSVVMETRTYDGTTGKTYSLRTKEDQYDYRFMPEPNLLPLFVYPTETFLPKLSQSGSFQCENNSELLFDQSYIDKIQILKNQQDFFVDLDKVRKELDSKELPQQRRDFIKTKFGLSDENCFTFVANDLDYILIEIMSHKTSHSSSDTVNDADYINILVKSLLNEYLNQVNMNPTIKTIDFKLKCKKIASYVDLIRENLISKRIYFKFFTLLFDTKNLDKFALQLVKEGNLFLINEKSKIESTVESLFIKNEKALNEYKLKPKKREKIFDFFVGRVHKELNDLADEDLVDEIVLKHLNKLVN